MGLVNKVVPGEELLKATGELANRLARMPTRALGFMKWLLYRSLNSDLDAMLEAEEEAQEAAALTADHREGVMAFFEKRAANFRGK
jgi:2-(1,2-epoxy-1,2-dihydrophenyl)acetyl-CoA isomerase